MHTWKILSACPLLNTDKNMSLSLPIALSLSLHLALSACLKIPYVIFIISLFLFFFFYFGGILSDEVERFAPSDALFIYWKWMGRESQGKLRLWKTRDDGTSEKKENNRRRSPRRNDWKDRHSDERRDSIKILLIPRMQCSQMDIRNGTFWRQKHFQWPHVQSST